MKFNPGIVICSRIQSSRIPGKPFKQIGDEMILQHLINQLKGHKIYLAVPEPELNHYGVFFSDTGVTIYGNHASDPLARTLWVAKYREFSHVVRITHDKIFIDISALEKALAQVAAQPDIDYLYSDKFTPGTGFEIISTACLERACAKYKNVEHITYAARDCAKKIICADLGQRTTTFNLLIDFPEDLKLMEVIFSQVKNPTLSTVLDYLLKNPKLSYVNAPPRATIYTCVHKGAEFIDRAMRSVANQKDFARDFEYIIVDDASEDSTLEQIAKFAVWHKNVKWYRNPKNIGLASSSNFALSRARGNYIIRLDADDFFTDPHAVGRLLSQAVLRKYEAVYPDFYHGTLNDIRPGSQTHHVGGALFDRNALNFIRFTDGLRNHDSLDIFTRAKDKLKIGYFSRPLFMYSQRDGSMSKTNVEERDRLAEQIKQNGGAHIG